jgi:hypothetical protein
MNKLNALDWVALILLVVGGLNWGLVGVLDFDLVATLFGDMSIVSRIVYAVVGLSAIYTLLLVGKLKKD